MGDSPPPVVGRKHGREGDRGSELWALDGGGVVVGLRLGEVCRWRLEARADAELRGERRLLSRGGRGRRLGAGPRGLGSAFICCQGEGDN